jgi:sterol O-acyltransferase
MKQHSYAFYTGWLSNEYLRRERLQKELTELMDDNEELSKVNSIAEERVRLISEIENMDRVLAGSLTGTVKYPNNLTFANFAYYMLCPTLIYELEYPRVDKYSPCLFVINLRIRISYVLEKSAATLGSIGLMILISEHYVLPAIQPILPSQTIGMSFLQKLSELGWVLLDMIFPYFSSGSKIDLDL